MQLALLGARIDQVILRRDDLRTKFADDFMQNLAGRRVESVHRRAKYLLFTLSGGATLIAHLGMSGRFSVEKKLPKKFKTHDHVVWKMDDGKGVIYNDPRRFGLMEMAKTEMLSSHPLLMHLGPEPLDKDFSASYLKTALLKRKGPIKPALMDQTLVVGVGNIYASEALFLACIHPETPAFKAASKAALIVKSIRKVLDAAIASGGSSLRDFLHVSGEAGYFQHRFNVYERKGERCFVCETPLGGIRQAGRSSFYCPSCQRLP